MKRQRKVKEGSRENAAEGGGKGGGPHSAWAVRWMALLTYFQSGTQAEKESVWQSASDTAGKWSVPCTRDMYEGHKDA